MDFESIDGDRGDPVVCDQCNNVVHLVETDEPSHELTCECAFLSIDVSDAVGHSSLFDPMTGHWDNIDDAD